MEVRADPWTPTEGQGPAVETVTVSVGDGVATATRSFSVTVAEVNQPPVLDPFPGLIAVESKTLQESISARDADLPMQTLTFRLLQAPNGVTLTPAGQLRWTPLRTDLPGEYPIRIEVSDGLVATQRDGFITVIQSGKDPLVIRVADVSVLENRPAGSVLSTPDPNLNGQLIWSLIQGPTGFSVDSSGRWSWQPGERFGGTRWTVVAEVTDGRLTSRIAFKVDVTEDNQPPGWAAVPVSDWPEGQESVLQLVANDSDEPIQPLTYRLVQGPSGLAVAVDGLVRWTPSESQAPGIHQIIVVVSDGVTSVTNRIDIVAREVNQPPTWSGPTVLSIDETRASESKLVAVDADIPGQTLDFSLVSGPPGLVVSRDGLLRWTPTEVQGPSTNQVTVSVSDGMASVSTGFSVVVEASPRLSLQVPGGNSVVLQVAGPPGALCRLEQAESPLGPWSTVAGVADITTQGFNMPLSVTLPGSLQVGRVYRLRVL